MKAKKKASELLEGEQITYNLDHTKRITVSFFNENGTVRGYMQVDGSAKHGFNIEGDKDYLDKMQLNTEIFGSVATERYLDEDAQKNAGYRTITLSIEEYNYLRNFVRDESVAADAECGECGVILSVDKLKKCLVYRTLETLGDTEGCQIMISDWKKCNFCEPCGNLFENCKCKQP